MKEIFISFLFLILFIKVHSQHYKDTLYDSRINNDSNPQVIFIDTPNSNFHKMVFRLLLSDTSSYQENFELIKVHSFQNHKSIPQYIGDWITINMYKGRPYAYYPSEPYFNTFIKITDSTILVNDFNDGLIFYIISKTIKKNSKFILHIINSSNKKNTLAFRLKHNGIYKVKSSLFNKSNISMVKKETYFKLPIIVNYCPEKRCQEFNFK